MASACFADEEAADLADLADLTDLVDVALDVLDDERLGMCETIPKRRPFHSLFVESGGRFRDRGRLGRHWRDPGGKRGAVTLGVSDDGARRTQCEKELGVPRERSGQMRLEPRRRRGGVREAAVCDRGHELAPVALDCTSTPELGVAVEIQTQHPLVREVGGK
jgi:hypothetical protein